MPREVVGAVPALEDLGYVIERHVTRRGSGLARYLDLRSRSVLRPGWPPAERFAHHLIDDAAAVTGAELDALLPRVPRRSCRVGAPPGVAPRRRMTHWALGTGHYR
ncbi:DUF6000 family protein [Streptomyces sp. NPDC000351]|uniref:DUF6000 family protein n=1 Tax=Streptomyces sp. NPDC000351 TaxID=3154250 RepID=UPI003320A7A2